jgi:hypothetical protein
MLVRSPKIKEIKKLSPLLIFSLRLVMAIIPEKVGIDTRENKEKRGINHNT